MNMKFSSSVVKANLSGSFMGTVTETKNYVTMLDEFHGDETLLKYHETLSFSLLVILAKLMIFNAMKSSRKLPLRLA